mmetsp:Transcript_27032/g.65691  ORF Transcript_27032/g.65691 Transcript_27032/m.65691 type:complete len:236 (+) Transcript_27032:906-1613(+)
MTAFSKLLSTLRHHEMQMGRLTVFSKIIYGSKYREYKGDQKAGYINLLDVLNAALGGLVAITAGCATTTGWGIVITGLIAGPLTKFSSVQIARLGIDDPVDAISVHGTCGILGLILPAFFSTQKLIDRAYGEDYVTYKVGRQIGVQLIGVVSIVGFAVVVLTTVLTILKLLPGGIRIDAKNERIGNDFEYFGGYAYPDWHEENENYKNKKEAKQELWDRQSKRFVKSEGSIKRSL